MTRSPIRVVKVGGSLFDLADLPKRLRAWLDSQPAAHNILIAGGGSLADQVRLWSAQHKLDDATAHWMCVDMLTVTARLLHAWLPEVGLVSDDRKLCSRVGAVGATIFDPASWMRDAEPRLPGDSLPQSWDTTSDAIAGRLAIALAADELALLKSALPPMPIHDWRALADAGYVDLALPTMSSQLPQARLVDLRLNTETTAPGPSGN